MANYDLGKFVAELDVFVKGQDWEGMQKLLDEGVSALPPELQQKAQTATGGNLEPVLKKLNELLEFYRQKITAKAGVKDDPTQRVELKSTDVAITAKEVVIKADKTTESQKQQQQESAPSPTLHSKLNRNANFWSDGHDFTDFKTGERIRKEGLGIAGVKGYTHKEESYDSAIGTLMRSSSQDAKKAEDYGGQISKKLIDGLKNGLGQVDIDFLLSNLQSPMSSSGKIREGGTELYEVVQRNLLKAAENSEISSNLNVNNPLASTGGDGRVTLDKQGFSRHVSEITDQELNTLREYEKVFTEYLKKKREATLLREKHSAGEYEGTEEQYKKDLRNANRNASSYKKKNLDPLISQVEQTSLPTQNLSSLKEENDLRQKLLEIEKQIVVERSKTSTDNGVVIEDFEKEKMLLEEQIELQSQKNREGFPQPLSYTGGQTSPIEPEDVLDETRGLAEEKRLKEILDLRIKINEVQGELNALQGKSGEAIDVYRNASERLLTTLETSLGEFSSADIQATEPAYQNKLADVDYQASRKVALEQLKKEGIEIGNLVRMWQDQETIIRGVNKAIEDGVGLTASAKVEKEKEAQAAREIQKAIEDVAATRFSDDGRFQSGIENPTAQREALHAKREITESRKFNLKEQTTAVNDYLSQLKDESKRLAGIFAEARKEGQSFDDALQTATEAINQIGLQAEGNNIVNRGTRGEVVSSVGISSEPLQKKLWQARADTESIIGQNGEAQYQKEQVQATRELIAFQEKLNTALQEEYRIRQMMENEKNPHRKLQLQEAEEEQRNLIRSMERSGPKFSYDEGQPTIATGTIGSENYKQVALDAKNAEQFTAQLDVVQQRHNITMQNIGRTVQQNTGFFQKLGQSVKQSFEHYSTAGMAFLVVQKLQDSLRQIIQLSKELDKSLTDLRIASGGTREEAQQMLKEYNALANQMGLTTVEVAKLADSWIRAGYEGAQANELIRASAMLAKLGQMEMGAATDSLISSMKGWKLEVSDAVSVVDKLTAVDLAAATSAGDLATAMAKGNVSAQQAGVSLDNYIGYIATIIDTSQQAPELVGTAMRTLFARMNNVKLNKFNYIAGEGESQEEYDSLKC